jgi:hypothetical protein
MPLQELKGSISKKDASDAFLMGKFVEVFDGAQTKILSLDNSDAKTLHEAILKAKLRKMGYKNSARLTLCYRIANEENGE